jgi:hypothetical protein
MSKIIVKHAKFFEIFSLLFSFVNIVNVFIEIHLLYIRKDWFTGDLRSLHFIMMQFFAVSFIVGVAAKTGFAVIREAFQKGGLKL